MQRPRRVADQELDGQQIQHDADRARDAVVRRAMPPGAMVDDPFLDRDADLARDGRQEAVHLAVELHRLDHFGAEHLQRAAVVVQLHAGRERDDGVGDHRRQPPAEERILPVLAPPGDDVRAALGDLDHRGNVARVVLQIAIGRHDETSAGQREPGRKRRGLPEVPAELDRRAAADPDSAASPAVQTCRRCSRRLSPGSRRGVQTP